MALAGRHRDIQLKLALERDVRLVRFEQGRIEFSPAPGASPQLAQTLDAPLAGMDGAPLDGRDFERAGRAEPQGQEDAKASEAMTGVRAEPLVRSVLAAFPGAEIVAVRA